VVLVSGGHNPGAAGATNEEGFSEYPETYQWAELIVARLSGHWKTESLVVPTGSLTSKIEFINKVCATKPVALAVEVHFNSSPGGKGRGSETLYCPGSTSGRVYAEVVQSSMATLMSPNRGVKEGWYQMNPAKGPDAFLKRTRCPAIILEPEFIQRQTVIEANREMCCEVIADAIVSAIS
jgi:N-acetylmuramoyl-L-alanine amidase